MFGRKRTAQARRCWYSGAVDLPGITAEQVWELVTPAVRPLRVTRLDRPYVAEGFAHRADPANGAVFDVGAPMGGARLTTHVWRDLPEGWADDAWVLDSMQDFLDRVRVDLGVEDGQRLPRDLVPRRTGPGLSPGPVDRQRVADRTVLPGVTPHQVWDLIRPAEAALYNPVVVEAYVEPGTGPGVGEVQVFVSESHGERWTSRHRVVHEDPPFAAIMDKLGDELPSSIAFHLEAHEVGTRIQVTHGVEHSPDRYVPDHLIDHREFTSGFFGWIRTALAD